VNRIIVRIIVMAKWMLRIISSPMLIHQFLNRNLSSTRYPFPALHYPLYFLALILTLTLTSPSYSAPTTITGTDGIEMVLVPEGSFYMGSEGENFPEDEKPRHEVYIRAFYMDRYEVTNRSFAEFLNKVIPDGGGEEKRKEWVVIRNDLETPPRANWFPTEIEFRDGKYIPLHGYEDYPVLTVSWYAANEYCRWAGERLPTEAEWEKAGRGGLKYRDFPWGNQIPTLESGVVFGRAWNDNTMPAPVNRVGNYPPNGYGLYDMAGSVQEWCADWYMPDYYKSSPYRNPTGPVKGTLKVMRGGSWLSVPGGLRVGARYAVKPSAQYNTNGFRCVKDTE